MIHQAAIMLNGAIWTLPKPARHANILWAMHDVMNNTNPGERPEIIPAYGRQGFITDSGRFVDRYEAFTIALRHSQFFRKPSAPPQLYSEDLW